MKSIRMMIFDLIRKYTLKKAWNKIRKGTNDR